MNRNHRSVMSKIQNSTVVRGLYGGLIQIIPVVIIGSFALMLRSLPIPAYQDFVTSLFGGVVVTILNAIYNATFGLLSIYLTVSVGIAFSKLYSGNGIYIYGTPTVSLIAFFILTGVGGEAFSLSDFGPSGMFTALFSGICASLLYIAVLKHTTSFDTKIQSEGAEIAYNNAVSILFPAIVVTVVFALGNFAIRALSHTEGFQQLFISITNQMFEGLGRTFGSGLLFVFLSSLMWFFGIHGSNVLNSVAENIFAPGTQVNAELIAGGGAPTEIVSKTFIDAFVLMGGCGTAICLLLAVLMISRKRSTKNLTRVAFFPMIFNINELLVFGLPVIFNPILLLPFIMTPIIIYFVSYFSMYIGIVPLAVNTVEWTTPIFMSGWLSTGSISGALLQLVNIFVGIAIYAPFIKYFDIEGERRAKENMSVLVEDFKKAEVMGNHAMITRLEGQSGSIARSLMFDIKNSLSDNERKMYFQPQFDAHGECVGVESLLRWDHPVYGLLYPPLVIRIAGEANILCDFEQRIFDISFAHSIEINKQLGGNILVAVNISAPTIQDKNFVDHLLDVAKGNPAAVKNICLEITEQDAMQTKIETQEIMTQLRAVGYKMAIDDFSMGHTSLRYLQENTFDIVKLDGGLVSDMRNNPRCTDIISSIVFLSRSLGFSVYAEYVETEEQRAALEKIGCMHYQGYLYSPALPLERVVEFVKRRRERMKEK